MPAKTRAARKVTPDVAVEAMPRTLELLVERLHPAVVDVVAAPRGLGVAITDPVILDPSEPQAPPAGSVVLAVGVDAPAARAGLLHRLAGAEVAAVVFKHAGPLETAVLAAADETGVALLAAPPGLAWGQLFTLVLTASNAAPPAAGGLPEAPLGDLFALANAVAAMVGGATTIEDPHSRVLAYSSLDHPIDVPRQETILGRQVPAEWVRRLHDSGVFRRLWQTDEVVQVTDFTDEPGYRPRIAVSVRAGGELLGSLWVIEGGQPLDAEARRTLREAADIAALHLLRHRSAHDVDRRRRSDALLSVLEGRDRGDRAHDVLDVDAHSPVAVIAFDAGEADDAAAVMRAQRVADLVAVYCESYRRQAACAVSGSRVYALVPALTTDGGDAAATLAEAIVARAGQALRVRLRAGVGSTVSGLAGVVESRREADRVLDVLTAAAEQVATIDQVRARVILDRLRRIAREQPDLTTGRLQALAEQDAAKGTAWVQTLRAYFDAFGDMAAAAAMVNVHPNTFRYRLRRITEVWGLDLDDPDERLVAELQLRFLEEPGRRPSNS